MSDDNKKLRDTLATLHQQLEEAQDIDPALAERLRVAVGDVQSALRTEGAAPAGQASLSDHLRESAAHFEQSHPTLAGTLHRLIDILGQMGI